MAERGKKGSGGNKKHGRGYKKHGTTRTTWPNKVTRRHTFFNAPDPRRSMWPGQPRKMGLHFRLTHA